MRDASGSTAMALVATRVSSDRILVDLRYVAEGSTYKTFVFFSIEGMVQLEDAFEHLSLIHI